MRFFVGLPLPSAGRAEEVVAVVADKLRAFRDVLVFLYDIKTEKRFEAMRKKPSSRLFFLHAYNLDFFRAVIKGLGLPGKQGSKNGCDGLIP